MVKLSQLLAFFSSPFCLWTRVSQHSFTPGRIGKNSEFFCLQSKGLQLIFLNPNKPYKLGWACSATDNEEQWDVAKSTIALALPILLV
jgi:hypothetical protein